MAEPRKKQITSPQNAYHVSLNQNQSLHSK